MIISITGTPGVGKTTLSKFLSKKLGYSVIHITDFVREKNLSSGYDKSFKAMIVDVKKLNREMKRFLKNKDNLIIDGHLSHFIPSDITFVIRLDPSLLARRLKRRGYLRKKILENIEAELLDVIYAEALNNSKNVIQINATSKKREKIINQMLSAIKGRFKGDQVDWLSKYSDVRKFERRLFKFKKSK